MYFFDSYALIEIIRGNKNYDKYKTESPVCSVLNLFELHYSLLKEFNKQTADYWINKFEYTLIEISKENIIEASDFKFENKDKEFSTIDCISYVLAEKRNLKFLTGDKDFEDIENVEYVK